MSTVWSRIKALSYSFPALAKEFVFQKGEVPYNEASYPCLDGQVWIVTGASSGIGKIVAASLAKQGAKVWLAARNERLLVQCIADIRAKQPDAKLDYFLVDFSDLATVKPGAQKFLASNDSLNGIVHNAGVMFPPRNSKSKQDYDLQLSTNNLGPHLLQRLLDESLISTSQAGSTGRLVWVSSTAHLGSPFDGGVNFEDPSYVGFNSIDGYGATKAGNIIESIQWTINHPDANVVSVSLHPGILKTELARHNSYIEKIMALGSWDPIYGARTELYAALSPDLLEAKNNNAYIEPWGRIGKARPDLVDAANDARRGGKFWKWENLQTDRFL